jgi:lipoprotein-releasing system permease protein
MAMRGLVDAGRPGLADPPATFLPLALGVWLLGWALLAAGFPRRDIVSPGESPAVGAPLWPPLARWRDFDLRTLAAYALAICGAELVLVLLHTLLASASRGVGWGLPTAFGVALSVATGVAFLGGFLGATWSHRLSAPEPPSPSLYFGVPLPAAPQRAPRDPGAGGHPRPPLP